MTSNRKFIITNLDAPTIDLTPFQYTEAEITLFGIVQKEIPNCPPKGTSKTKYEEIRDVLKRKKVECERYRECTQDDINGKIHCHHFNE